MAEDILRVTAEIQRPFRPRGGLPPISDASPAVETKVREGLRAALQAQLAEELATLGEGGPADLMAIHGRTGVSNTIAQR